MYILFNHYIIFIQMTVEKYIKTMPARMQAVIKAKVILLFQFVFLLNKWQYNFLIFKQVFLTDS